MRALVYHGRGDVRSETVPESEAMPPISLCHITTASRGETQKSVIRSTDSYGYLWFRTMRHGHSFPGALRQNSPGDPRITIPILLSHERLKFMRPTSAGLP